MKNSISLDAQVELMMNYIHDLEPDVRLKFNPQVYEDEHANISVYPPLLWDDEHCLNFQEKIGDRVIDVHLDSGFLILVYVYMPQQQVAEARRERELAEKTLKATEQRRAEAEQVLTEAKALGLTPVGVD
jgi:hypothetical protein